MPRRFGTITDQFVHERTMRRWRKARGAASGMGGQARAALVAQARALHTALTAFEVAACSAAASAGERALQAPLHSDWTWRPDLWSEPLERSNWISPETPAELCPRLRQFHDCPQGEIVLRQCRTAPTYAPDNAPFGLEIDVFAFEGSFLSLVFDLPATALAGLRSRHLLGIGLALHAERPVETFARLNIRQGPNTAQIVREIPPQDQNGARTLVEFDLAYSANAYRQVDHLWLDLIFEAPAMNRIAMNDVFFSRRPRAEL